MREHINCANTINIALINDLIFKDLTFLLIVCPFVFGTLLLSGHQILPALSGP